MKNAKRVPAFLLAVLLVLSGTPLGGFVGLQLPDFDLALTAEAADVVDSGTCGDNLTWTLTDDGTLTVSGTGAMMEFIDGSWILPTPWETYNGTIKNVIIENGITSVGAHAFEECYALTGVTFSETLITIGKFAFAWCRSLTDIVLPVSLLNIGAFAFYDCKALTEITIPASVESIGDRSFMGCESLSTVVIPNSVKSIMAGAFADTAYYNESSNWEDGVLYIGNHLIAIAEDFTGICNMKEGTQCIATTALCVSGLTAVQVPESNPYYCTVDGVLYNKDCTSLICYPSGKTDTSFAVPESVIKTEILAFSCNPYLASVALSSASIHLGAYALYGCTNLNNIDFAIDSTVVMENYALGENAFSSLHFNGIDLTVKPLGVSSFNNVATLVFEDCNVTLHPSAFAAGNALIAVDFINCNTLLKNCGYKNGEYTDSEDLYEFEGIDNIFNDCDMLETLRFEGGAASIGFGAFSGSYSLKNVIFDNCEVERIASFAFAESVLETISAIPASVSYIGEFAFAMCVNLESIDVSPDNAYYSSEDGVLCDKEKTTLICYPSGKQDESYTVPATIEKIETYVLYGNENLKELTIVNPDTSFSMLAFCGGLGIERVTLPDGLTELAPQLFLECNNLSEINLPESLTIVNELAFMHCALTEVVVPSAVEVIDRDAFICPLVKFTVLNPECEIYDSEYTIYQTATIYGYEGSTAQAYAEKYNRTFVALETECEHDWQYSGVTVPATCTQQGTALYVCSLCGECKDGIVSVDPANHTGGTEVRNVTSATCGQNGYTGDTYCLGCNTKIASGETVAATGNHNWIFTEVTAQPTCAQQGSELYTCTLCGGTTTAVLDVDSTAHGNNRELRNVVEPTATSKGYSGDLYCLDCGVRLAKGKVLPAAVVSSFRLESDGLKDADGIVAVDVYLDDFAGLTAFNFYIDIDENLFSYAGLEAGADALAVNTLMSNEVYLECNEYNGQIELSGCFVHCLYNAQHYNDASVNAGRFHIATVLLQADETAETLQMYATSKVDYAGLTVDGYTYPAIGQVNTLTAQCNVILQCDHDWQFTRITTPATCTQTGTVLYTCSVCGETKNETVATDPANHAGGTEIRNALTATCGKNGYTGDSYCLGCNAKLASGSVISATGNHDWQFTKVTVTATCNKQGSELHTCSACGQTKIVNTAVDPENHAGGTQVRNATTATCGKDGYTGDTYCLGCNTKLASGSSVPATGIHTWNKGVVTQAPSGNTPGVKTFTCITCAITRTEVIAPSESYFEDDERQAIIIEDIGIVTIQGASVADFLEKSSENTVILDAQGNELSEDEIPGTGCVLVLSDGTEYPIVVMGDVNGDGDILASDARLALRAAVNLETYDGVYSTAANIDGDGNIGVSDARLILRASVHLDDPDEWFEDIKNNAVA